MQPTELLLGCGSNTSTRRASLRCQVPESLGVAIALGLAGIPIPWLHTSPLARVWEETGVRAEGLPLIVQLHSVNTRHTEPGTLGWEPPPHALAWLLWWVV